MNIISKLNKTWIKFTVFYLVCILFLLIGYQSSFHAMFRNDEWIFMRDNGKLLGNFDLFNYLKRSLITGAGEIHHFAILSNFSSFCKFYIFGNNLFLHHLASFLIHSINTLFSFLFAYLLTRNYRIAITSMFLFASSYLIFDTVSWAGQWAFLNITMVNLSALILLILYFRNNKRKIFLSLSIILAIIGMFIFEPGIVIPMNLAVFSFYFLLGACPSIRFQNA